MSLINEALKKAQMQESAVPDPAPAAAVSAPTPLGPAVSTSQQTGAMLRIFGLMALLALVCSAGVAYLVSRIMHSPAEVPPPPPRSSPTAVVSGAAPAANPERVADAAADLPEPSHPISGERPLPSPETSTPVVAALPAPPEQTAADSGGGVARPLEQTRAVVAAVETRALEVEAVEIMPDASPAEDGRTTTGVRSPVADPVAAPESSVGSPVAAVGEGDRVSPPISTTPAARPRPESAPKPAGPNPAASAYVDRLQIRSIMSGGRRVLIYDPDRDKTLPYQPGSVVSHDLQLRVRDIFPSYINFVDSAGNLYVKHF